MKSLLGNERSAWGWRVPVVCCSTRVSPSSTYRLRLERSGANTRSTCSCLPGCNLKRTHNAPSGCAAVIRSSSMGLN
ncbi:hypothetical protein PFLmoz3_03754 [Pseudomonas fluorescens]|uniref:Uncharacterized protein n=1 Tax=Pseudomonas fluorescens TaxID=294 RepID=A0A109LG22_PSEFL|nr:hypothetical protein PFLmoz3_03754 [Pseudomonas fluorescens]